jgi:hypothetical protein
MMTVHVTVRANDELLLDVGTCEEVPGKHDIVKLISAPAETMFHQVCWSTCAQSRTRHYPVAR